MKPPDQRRGHPKKGHPQRTALAPRDFIAPRPPSGLSAASRRRWQKYWRSPSARAADLGADLYVAERWIRLVDELETVYPVFQEERVVAGSTGQPVLNPLWTQIKDLEGQIHRLEAQLGMGPMSRLRLGISLAEGRMTAAKLNESLNRPKSEPKDEPSDERAGVRVIEGEWKEATS